MQRTTKTVSIASGQSLSTAGANLGEGVPVAIIMPAAFTGTQITFQGSHDNSTYYNLYDAAGSEITQTVAASRFVVLDANLFAGMTYLKVRSGTASVPTAEAANRTLELVTRMEIS